MPGRMEDTQVEERKKTSIGDKKVPKKPAVVKNVDSKGNAITKKPAGSGKFGKAPAQKGKNGKAKAESKPWEKMYQKSGAKDQKPGVKGQKPADKERKPAAKVQKTGDAAVKNKKPVKEMRDFLYLLPKRTSAKSLFGALSFLDPKDVEIWEDECVIEISAGEGTITFEDIRESLEKEDKEILNDLRMKQVISCDYESTDAELVQKIMDAFLKAFGGKIGSDTEDFTPFLEVKNL